MNRAKDCPQCGQCLLSIDNDTDCSNEDMPDLLDVLENEKNIS